jgi:CheY-like chemotaxis protein
MSDVLIVEPTPLVLDMMTEALRDAGLRVVEATSADAALAAVSAASHLPGVLVTSLALDHGGLDGRGLAAILRRRSPGLGVIYLAERSTALAEDALDARERCLTKPFDPARLARLICELAPPCPKPPRLIRGRAVMR